MGKYCDICNGRGDIKKIEVNILVDGALFISKKGDVCDSCREKVFKSLDFFKGGVVNMVGLR